MPSSCLCRLPRCVFPYSYTQPYPRSVPYCSPAARSTGGEVRSLVSYPRKETTHPAALSLWWCSVTPVLIYKTPGHRLHHLHLSINREGRWAPQMFHNHFFLHFSLFSTAPWDLANSKPVHSLMLSSHLFLCLPYLLRPFTVPCKMVLARPEERETCPYHFNLRLFTMVKRSSCVPIACWIMARTSSLVAWSLHGMCSIIC